MSKIKFIEPNIDLIKEYKTYSDKMSDENTFILMNGEKYNLDITSEIIKNLQDKSVFPFAKWAISNKKIVGQIFLRTFNTERSRGVHKLTMLLHILPEYRGQKIASELLSQAKQKANELGFKLILIQVFEQNAPAINLYHKFGFKTVGIIPKGYFYNNEFVDERIMYLDL